MRRLTQKLRGSPRPAPGKQQSLIQTKKPGPATSALDRRTSARLSVSWQEREKAEEEIGVRDLSQRSREHSECGREADTKTSSEKQENVQRAEKRQGTPCHRADRLAPTEGHEDSY